MTADGTLLVYYITNLIVMQRYEDSLKILESQQSQEQEPLCQANLRRLHAYALYRSTQNTARDVKAKIEEAGKLFGSCKSTHGQALCAWALGFLYYSHKEQFVYKHLNSEAKVLDAASAKLEEAIKLYAAGHHFAGQSYCHQLLQYIKVKNKESVRRWRVTGVYSIRTTSGCRRACGHRSSRTGSTPAS